MATGATSATVGATATGLTSAGMPSWDSAYPNTMAQQIIPAVPYWQYNDDPNISAFFDATNTLAQEYVDWFNQINLPVYAGNDQLTGDILDWVLTGLYNQPRPVLPSNLSQSVGPYNTFAFDEEAYNDYVPSQVSESFQTTDDIYKRIATWNIYTGDGKNFTISWLKRRIKRFLTGANGMDATSAAGPYTYVDNTYEVSVTFTGPQECTVKVDTSNGYAVMWDTLKAALRSGACQLPFMYEFVLI
ncbi:hypothetical protein [Paraburkholderia tropica]|uniref:hypothetical protein n=1 Tax=Paraburkholderia tropica TaxID=92647 RepID=UPI002AAF5A65|nr:hypothetical protein [Paraburkholderia tropica]